MVNLVFTVVSLAVLVVAMVTRSETAAVLPHSEENAVLSANSETTPSESPTSIPTLEPTPTVIPLPTATTSATPIPTRSPIVSQTAISEWVYTGSITDKSLSESAVSFSTTDTPKVVTAWYKDKMIALGFSTKSVIQTQSNSKILNKIVASGTKGTVSIEITQDTASAPTHVTVNIDTDASGNVNVSVNNSI